MDSGLAAALAGRDQDPALDRDPGFAGALVETMVANDLRVQAGALEAGARLYHYREDSAEVDLIVEDGDGMVTGIEIKLSPNPRDGDLAGMRRLAKACGARWASGVVLCRVPAGRLTDDGITLAPIEAVWQV